MSKYQINATIESFNFENCELNLKGVGKYCFEKENEKNKEKEYWNIFENKEGTANFKFKIQSEPIKIKISKDGIGMQLLSYAFAEKKKLKFELNISSEQDKNSESYTIIGISHAPN